MILENVAMVIGGVIVCGIWGSVILLQRRRSENTIVSWLFMAYGVAILSVGVARWILHGHP